MVLWGLNLDTFLSAVHHLDPLHAGCSFALPPPDPELSSPLALLYLPSPLLGVTNPSDPSLLTLTCLLVSFPDAT